MELPRRENIRLQGNDYSSNGAYFVTICTHNRECLFGEIVGVDAYIDPYIQPLSQRIKSFKTLVTKEIGVKIWQRNYHEHIIRNESEYKKICEYIDTNPYKWVDDCYYSKGKL